MIRLRGVVIALVVVATRVAAQNGTTTTYVCADRAVVATAQLCAAHGGVASVRVEKVMAPKNAIGSFQQGNPDHPVVTGGVYNGTQPADSSVRHGLGHVSTQVLTTPTGATPTAVLCKDGTTVTAAKLCDQHGGPATASKIPLTRPPS